MCSNEFDSVEASETSVRCAAVYLLADVTRCRDGTIRRGHFAWIPREATQSSSHSPVERRPVNGRLCYTAIRTHPRWSHAYIWCAYITRPSFVRLGVSSCEVCMASGHFSDSL